MWERRGFVVGDLVPGPDSEAVRMVRLIAEGGYSVVYEGRREPSGAECAVKALRLKHQGDRQEVERLLREGKALYALRHPNVVPVTYIGMRTEDELIYLVMRLLKGRNLRELQQDLTASRRDASREKGSQRHGRLPVSWALEIGMPICSGLHAIHTQALAVHRDLKPENIYVEDDGSVVLFDIGSAKFSKQTRLTTHDVTIGTAQYMSPEQLSRPGEIDYRSDQFSLGVILYELLSGLLPFAPAPGESNDAQALGWRIMIQPHRPLKEVAPHVPDYIVEIVERLLRKKPEERYPSAARVRELLEAALARFVSQLGDLAPLSLAAAIGAIPRTAPDAAAQPPALPALATSTNPFITISLPPEEPRVMAAPVATTEEFPATVTLLPPVAAEPTGSAPPEASNGAADGPPAPAPAPASEADRRPVYVFVPPPTNPDLSPRDGAHDSNASGAAPHPDAALASPSGQTQRRVAALRRHIAELPEDLRQAFVLNQLHEMPVEEIAEAIGVPAAKVRERVLVARAKLGARMTAEEASEARSEEAPQTSQSSAPANDDSAAHGEGGSQDVSQSEDASKSLSSHVREVPPTAAPGRRDTSAWLRAPAVRRIAVACAVVAVVANTSLAFVCSRLTEAQDRGVDASVTVATSASSSAGAPPTSVPTAVSVVTAASSASSPSPPVPSPARSAPPSPSRPAGTVALGHQGGTPAQQKPAATTPPPAPPPSPPSPPPPAAHRIFGTEN